ncbi:MAG: tetratricopeptide repeat protein, partial [Deltaproteobacteria bacterium]|nr:tetratricopeptide repeat protein [Deltaproteobacteria bacterium]
MANKDKLLANAQKFLSKGQIPKAISEYQKLVDAFPKDVRNRQKLAELYSRGKRNADALTEYEAVAKHYTETGFYLKAIAVLKQMQKIEPSRVDIYHRLAELNEKQGLVGNALTEYRNLISFYDKNEMHHEAIEVLEKMLDLDPGNLNFSAKITEMYMISGQEEQAFEKFQGIINPLVANEEHTKIIKLYERFLDLCSEDGTARLPLARALLNSGSSDKAVQILKSLLKHSPEDPDINQCLTDAYVASQDFANARLTLKHLLKQKEDDLDLREYYVRICIDAGEMERARDRLEEWKDAFFQAERITVLQGFYEEIKEQLTDDPLVADTLFVIYESVGDTAKLDKLTAPEGVSVETAEISETADAAILDVAIDDVETLDMVGEEAASDVDVPPLDGKPSAGTVTLGKNAAAGL